MTGPIELLFPGLIANGFQVTSPKADNYNCIAWAAGDSTNWWWPDDPDNTFWPPGIPRVETLDAFRAAFETLGYAVCADEQFEPGHEKIAMFALAGFPTHAARQLPNGHWTSKLGPQEDIEHSLHDLTGMVYGSVVLIMKRPVASTKPAAAAA